MLKVCSREAYRLLAARCIVCAASADLEWLLFLWAMTNDPDRNAQQELLQARSSSNANEICLTGLSTNSVLLPFQVLCAEEVCRNHSWLPLLQQLHVLLCTCRHGHTTGI